MRATILGLGGEHYDLGMDGEIAFQPLARIDQRGLPHLGRRMDRRALAAGGCSRRPPNEKAAIWSALGSLAGAPVEQRTMTGPVGAAAVECAAPGARAVRAGRRRTASCWMRIRIAWAPASCSASRWRN